jgi:hypothetical protein
MFVPPASERTADVRGFPPDGQSDIDDPMPKRLHRWLKASNSEALDRTRIPSPQRRALGRPPSFFQVQRLEQFLIWFAEFFESQHEKTFHNKNVGESDCNCQDRIEKNAKEDRNSEVKEHNDGKRIEAKISEHLVCLRSPHSSTAVGAAKWYCYVYRSDRYGTPTK